MEPTTPQPLEARQYGEVAAIYDALMTGSVPHAAWLSRIEKEARARGSSPRSALDVACGTGIVTFRLAQRGYAPLVGVDLSPAMIAIARTKAAAKNLPITFVVQNAAHLDLDGHFDLVVSLFDSLNYVLDPADLRAAFCQIFAHTTPGGGVFAFDLNSLYALAHDFFSQTSTIGPVRHVWKSYWDRETRLCRVEMAFWVRDETNNAVRHFTETHVQRAYTVPEILDWLAEAGFVRIECFGGYSSTRPPTATSDRLLFIAERP